MKSKIQFFSIFLFLLLFSCAGGIRESFLFPEQENYITSFPLENSSAHLQKITNTVKKVSSTGYYTGYVFPEGSRVTETDLTLPFIQRNAEKTIFFNNSVAGTATIILSQNNKIALLTCAHVVTFPDTLIQYFPNPSGDGRSNYIQSIALLSRQTNYVVGLPESGEIDILQSDRDLDLALLGKEFKDEEVAMNIPVFNYQFGNAQELQWGNFVYLVGFPRGYQMVTRGLVSSPNRNKMGSFLIDATFNKGLSGGIVLAARGDSPRLELVGVTNSAAADFRHKLVPSIDATSEGYIPNIPYNDEIYVEQDRNINYGVTFAISSEEILEFISQRAEELRLQGYEFDFLLRRAN